MHPLQKLRSAFRDSIFLGLAMAFAFTPAATLWAQDDTDLTFHFKTFTVPGAVVLNVDAINNGGTISGYFTDAGGDSKGYTRSAKGVVTTLVDPLDTGSPGYTIALQISQKGTVGGEFYDDSTSTYSGFLYKSGAYTTYNVPNQPKFTSTAIYGVNDAGDICGFIFPPPYKVAPAFFRLKGKLHIVKVEKSAQSACVALNQNGDAVGFYLDSAGVDHGFLRTAAGKISTIDVPGAATTPGVAPCVSGNVAGSVAEGINIHGEISGHYWDTAYNEHGFVRTTDGKFHNIDYPGAYQTSGGGLNDAGNVVGHYADKSCNDNGYIAIP
jgi:hypothetical protein